MDPAPGAVGYDTHCGFVHGSDQLKTTKVCGGQRWDVKGKGLHDILCFSHKGPWGCLLSTNRKKGYVVGKKSRP